MLVRKNGKAFSVPLVLWRAFVGAVSIACFGAGFFWPLIDPYHRTWHDLAAGTVVVRRHVRIRRAAA